jgi:anti-sigma factor RsiW
MTAPVLDEMACDELVRLVTDYFEDALSLEDRTRLEHHLAICKGCAEYVRQMRKTIEAAGAPRGEKLSEETKDDLLRAFRELCK